MARSKVNPSELPTLDDLDDGPAAELREMEARAERLSEAADAAHDEFRRLENEYLSQRDEGVDFDALAENILQGDDVDQDIRDWGETATAAKEELRRYKALNLAESKLRDRIEEHRKNGAADQLWQHWREPVEENTREIGSLVRQLADRLELQEQLRRSFKSEVDRGDHLPGFPPPAGARGRAPAPTLQTLGRLCEHYLDDYDNPL